MPLLEETQEREGKNFGNNQQTYKWTYLLAQPVPFEEVMLQLMYHVCTVVPVKDAQGSGVSVAKYWKQQHVQEWGPG
jgi:hypothetical protein